MNKDLERLKKIARETRARKPGQGIKVEILPSEQEMEVIREINKKHLASKVKGYTEKDPNGIDQHEHGAKLDEGKLLANILQQFSLALTEVLKVATFGANKYTRGGWQSVDNGFERYSDAMMRHYLKETQEDTDPDSGLSHEAHFAWNALARLEHKLRMENAQRNKTR